jgi:hypothetical protein
MTKRKVCCDLSVADWFLSETDTGCTDKVRIIKCLQMSVFVMTELIALTQVHQKPDI